MAIGFNASADYLRRTTGLPSPTAFTICGWAMRRALRSDFQYFAGLDNGNNAWVLIGWDPSGTMHVTSDSNGTSYGNFASSPANNQWFFFAIACSGTGSTGLRGVWAAPGGQFVTASTWGSSFTPTALYLANDGWGEWCDIVLERVVVYDSALTDEQLYRQMHQGYPVQAAYIWSPLWSASDLADYSGNARNWTSGGTLTSEAGPSVGYGAPVWVVPWVEASAPTSIEGALDATLDDATLDAAGELAINGTLDATLDDATLSSAGVLALAGQLAQTLDDATLAATGELTIIGSLDATLDDVALTATGTLALIGTLDATLDNATLEATGELALVGALAATLADTTLSSAGALALVGQLAQTLEDATLDAAGQIVVGLSGSLDATLDDATLAATGVLALVGQLTQTLDDATVVATGALAIAGTLAATLDDATLVAAGTGPPAAITGEVAITLADAMLAATARLAIVGQATITLEDVTLDAIGVAVLIVALVRGNVRGARSTGTARGARPTGTARGINTTGLVRG